MRIFSFPKYSICFAFPLDFGFTLLYILGESRPLVLYSSSLTIPKFRMKAISILSISSLVFIISLPTNAMQPTNHGFQGSKPNCTYSIEIETTCAQSAETTDHVSVRFSDLKGDLIIVKHLRNPKLLYAPKGGSKRGGYSGFGRCAIDEFKASGPCMSSRVCSLYLKKVGADDWRPGWVKVLHQQDGGHEEPVSYVFYFRTFVPENVWYGFDYCHSKGGFVPHVVSFDD